MELNCSKVWGWLKRRVRGVEREVKKPRLAFVVCAQTLRFVAKCEGQMIRHVHRLAIAKFATLYSRPVSIGCGFQFR